MIIFAFATIVTPAYDDIMLRKHNSLAAILLLSFRHFVFLFPFHFILISFAIYVCISWTCVSTSICMCVFILEFVVSQVQSTETSWCFIRLPATYIYYKRQKFAVLRDVCIDIWNDGDMYVDCYSYHKTRMTEKLLPTVLIQYATSFDSSVISLIKQDFSYFKNSNQKF